MGALCGCMFQTGYRIYADTCVGRHIHEKMLSRLRNQRGSEVMHTHMTPFKYGDLTIQPIPVMYSNYTYLIGDTKHKTCVLVDVGDPSLFIKLGIRPTAILTTHKHWDHSYGNRIMTNAFGDIPIYGGVRDNVPGASITIQDGDVIRFGRLEFTAIGTPGHTKGHMCYLLNGENFDAPFSLFSGDHLMMGGCGANFEGSVKTMIESLELLKVLPDSTLVWPGHEAALNNLFLASFLESENQAVLVKLVWVYYRRSLRLCTCPSTLGEEKEYNPFLRTRDESLIKHLGLEHLLESKTPMDQVAVACFHEIVSKSRDTSDESVAKRNSLLTWVTEQTKLYFADDGVLESCSLFDQKLDGDEIPVRATVSLP